MSTDALIKRIFLKGLLTGCILGIGLACARWFAAFYADRPLICALIVAASAVFSALLLLYRDSGYWELSFWIGVLFSSPFYHLLQYLPVWDWNKYYALRPSEVITVKDILSLVVPAVSLAAVWVPGKLSHSFRVFHPKNNRSAATGKPIHLLCKGISWTFVCVFAWWWSIRGLSSYLDATLLQESIFTGVLIFGILILHRKNLARWRGAACTCAGTFLFLFLGISHSAPEQLSGFFLLEESRSLSLLRIQYMWLYASRWIFRTILVTALSFHIRRFYLDQYCKNEPPIPGGTGGDLIYRAIRFLAMDSPVSLPFLKTVLTGWIFTLFCACIRHMPDAQVSLFTRDVLLPGICAAFTCIILCWHGTAKWGWSLAGGIGIWLAAFIANFEELSPGWRPGSPFNVFIILILYVLPITASSLCAFFVCSVYGGRNK